MLEEKLYPDEVGEVQKREKKTTTGGSRYYRGYEAKELNWFGRLRRILETRWPMKILRWTLRQYRKKGGSAL